MTRTPLVSVVIPAYNAAAYLREAIDSVLAQTLPDLEVIVVDDGSNDATALVAASVADPRLRVMRLRHAGPSAARNAGWQASSNSAYVAFLDADDRWDADKVRRQVELLDSKPECAAVGTLMRYISSSGRVLGRSGQLVTAKEQGAIARGELFPFQMSSVTVRRDALAAAGGFDEALGRLGSEDLDLLARLARLGTIECVPEQLGSYRIHKHSAMAQHRIRINRAARFVRRRMAARDAGGDLTWDAFVQSESTSAWAERHQDAVECCYRAAALWMAEGRPLKAAIYGALALIINPHYTLVRLYRQRLARIPTASAVSTR